ncbi:methylated-DNA--[protein]-cysteine S-methyltransferase [uncultured Desulfovibrio sp.]|uniref:methylated-DNA--[protein]-cysteine S-methyltransferase n=1 Tax=uncultured Desulfovibrio sp. TaxID=167968 RepID=UPI00265CA244|nr:methylated-DNA--[protein]-cysteine S-methyltransferase [uncultured Desulfovibrio sp.]
MPVAGLESPVGPLWLTEEDGHLVALDRTCPLPAPGLCPPGAVSLPGQAVTSPLLHAAREQLAAYFAGRLRRFDLPLAPRGTPFQLRVWRALQDIPYGRTCSYSELAAAVGDPRACRAVGRANGRNPLMIVIPCHRVIAAGGGLGGYSGGLAVKRFLLRLEAGLPLPAGH